MQRVAEFMEQRVRLVVAQQARLALAGAREIHHVHDDRRGLAVEPALVAQRRHPGAAVFGGPVEIIADEQRDRLAARISHAPGARILVRQVDVSALVEIQSEQTARDLEGRGDDIVERQMRLQRALVEIIQRLAPLFRVIAPVPWLQFEIAALGGDHLLQGRGLAQGLRARGRPDLPHEIERRPRRLRHRVVEAEIGVAGIAEKARFFGAQPQRSGHDRAIVVRAAIGAARGERAP